MKIKRLIIVLLFVLLSAMIVAPSLSYGQTLTPRAEDNLGYAYQYGHGVPQNYYTAVYWFKLAAAQGYATAQRNLSVIQKQK